MPNPQDRARARRPDKLGAFDFNCDVFCGSGHEEMAGRIVVSAPAAIGGNRGPLGRSSGACAELNERVVAAVLGGAALLLAEVRFEHAKCLRDLACLAPARLRALLLLGGGGPASPLATRRAPDPGGALRSRLRDRALGSGSIPAATH